MSAIAVMWILFLQDSVAREIKPTNEVDLSRSTFSLNCDAASYQILYKEHGKGYQSYYKIVREKIIQKLNRNCKDYFKKGDVKIFFILNSSGALNSIAVDIGKSTEDKGLVNIVLLSLQQASPFPPFPKELKASQLPFSVTVAFADAN